MGQAASILIQPQIDHDTSRPCGSKRRHLLPGRKTRQCRHQPRLPRLHAHPRCGGGASLCGVMENDESLSTDTDSQVVGGTWCSTLVSATEHLNSFPLAAISPCLHSARPMPRYVTPNNPCYKDHDAQGTGGQQWPMPSSRVACIEDKDRTGQPTAEDRETKRRARDTTALSFSPTHSKTYSAARRTRTSVAARARGQPTLRSITRSHLHGKHITNHSERYPPLPPYQVAALFIAVWGLGYTGKRQWHILPLSPPAYLLESTGVRYNNTPEIYLITLPPPRCLERGAGRDDATRTGYLTEATKSTK